MRRLVAPLCLAALSSSPLLAQTGVSALPSVQRAIDLPQAIARALADSPALAAARLEVEATEAARLQAAARPNPTLGMEVEDTRRESRTTTLQLSQPIELGGKRAARVLAADRARDLAQAQLAAQRADVRAAVTSAHFDALLAQERVRLAQASLQLARGGAEVASKRVVAGKISPVEETKAKVAESGVRIELLQARGELRSALHALNASMGVPAGSFDAVDAGAAALPAAMSGETLAARLAASPVLRQAQLDAERLGALAEVERARRIPDVTVSVGAKRSEELGRSQAIVGLSIPLPVFDTNRNAEHEALKRRDKARAEAQAAALRVQAEAMQAQERLSAARAEVDSLQHDVLPGAQSAYDAATKGFELGKFGFLDVLDAQRTLLQAKAQHLRALAETHRAAIEIDRLLGAPHDIPATRPVQP
jgi:cobalt-zinc-cadmium efflux system outer membrane protein